MDFTRPHETGSVGAGVGQSGTGTVPPSISICPPFASHCPDTGAPSATNENVTHSSPGSGYETPSPSTSGELDHSSWNPKNFPQLAASPGSASPVAPET